MAKKTNPSIPKERKDKSKEITTIKLDNETKSRLDRLKVHEKESYNEIINKLLNILNIFKKNPALGNKILANIDRSIEFRKVYSGSIQENDSE